MTDQKPRKYKNFRDLSRKFFEMTQEERDAWVLERCSDKKKGREMLERYPEIIDRLNQT